MVTSSYNENDEYHRIASREMDALLDSFVDEGMTVGVSALIALGDRDIYFHSHGFADKGRGIEFSRPIPLRVYSMTKPVTAVAALTLVEKGVIGLDDPICEYIAEFSDMKVAMCDALNKVELIPAVERITVRQLLTMTSGLSYPENNGNAANRYIFRAHREICDSFMESEKNGSPMSAVDFARLAAKTPLCFYPGKTWLYGLSYDILGAVIEVASGMSLDDYMKKSIFTPLGMNHTTFFPSDEELSSLATIYTPEEGAFKVWNDGSMLPFTLNKRFCSGGGGLISTIDDYMRFAKLLLCGGGELIGSETLSLMTRDALTDVQRRGYNWLSEFGYSYGFGVRIMKKPQLSSYHESVGSFGWNGIAGTSVHVDPAKNSAAIFFTQRKPADYEKFLPDFTRLWQRML